MKEQFKEIRIGGARLAIIEQANAIIREYQTDGFDLTLRSLYYQFVRRDLFPASWADPKTGSTNNERSYKNLGNILDDGRLAGLVDWAAMVDKGRFVRTLNHWDSPADIVEACARQFRIDVWADQKYRPEVWIEKDALVNVIEGVTQRERVPLFSCRGYTSQSSMYEASKRLLQSAADGQTPVIIHLGDHDPSGIDMSRDIEDRLTMFCRGNVEVRRIALNMDQVEKFNPPPNPAKVTDSRFKSYRDEHGEECWELDALEPRELDRLITAEIKKLRNKDKWAAKKAEQENHREDLQSVAQRWDEVVEYVKDN